MAVAHKLPDPIIHRDLKPENILVSRSDPFPPQLKISDFGIGGVSLLASVKTDNVVNAYSPNNICSRDYASWEQVHDTSRIVANDDVYALGVIFWELLTNVTDTAKPTNSTTAIEQKEQLRRTGMTDEEIKCLQSKQGMTKEQVQFLQSCFGDKRPKDAEEMAKEIEEWFPPLREQLKKDVEEIAKRRKNGENCRQYIQEVFEKRSTIWSEAAQQQLPDAQWLWGMCRELGRGIEPVQTDTSRQSFGSRRLLIKGMSRPSIRWHCTIGTDSAV